MWTSHRILILLLLTCSGGRLHAQEGLLARYSFDEAQGTRARDSSGNGLEGEVSATRVPSPSGKALSFDGQPDHIVKVQIPEALRFGKNSWTFCAWLNPTQFTIDDAQNQRRVFAFGVYPDAYLVFDLMGSGHLNYYFCYRDPKNSVLSASGTASIALERRTWAHVALICDRKTREVTILINGFEQAKTPLPHGFDGDFSAGGELTLGNAWHNYHGLMDEVSLYRRALSRAEIRTEFSRRKGAFGVTRSPQFLAAVKQETLLDLLAQSNAAWKAGKYAEARAVCARIVAETEASPALRSIAHLRLAESWIVESKRDAARREFQKIAQTEAYPALHRREARERAADRFPPNPAASRTVVPPVKTFAAQVFVAPNGKDTQNGTAAAPVASLSRARDLVRELKTRGVRGAIAVNILPGEYRVTETFALTAEDSGTLQSPIVYRATQPGKAVFYGGTRVKGFTLVTDPAILERLPKEARGKVMQCDLRAQGVTDYGALAVRGFGQPPSPPTLELFVNGRPMTLARWPNTGFVGIRRLIEPGSRAAGKPSVFEYLEDRHARWTQAEDAWLFGYFRYLWADATIQIGKIDPATRTLTTKEAYHYDQPGMDTRQGIQYYAFNVLEEIDLPGEWYLDRNKGVLYLYPPADITQATVEIGLLAKPMITMDRVTDVRLEGVTFDLARYNGIVLTDCRRCLIAGCTVQRMAGNGITIQGGEANGLLSCDIHTIGRRASEVIGGDRATLTPGRHFVENCRISNFGRIDRTYTPAVQLEGVGNRVAFNQMFDCPSSVMRIEGNDHLIEYNEVYNAVQESDDQGAMELFGNPTYRGVVFRYNRFTHCGKRGAGVSVHGQAAIRLDDVISGIVIYRNTFVNCANGNFGAVQMNGGRDNVIDSNLFVNCKQGISGGWYPSNPIWQQAASKEPPESIILSPLYRQRYPEINTMLVGRGINRVWRNTFVGCGPMTTGDSANLELLENEALPPAGDAKTEPVGLYRDRYRTRLSGR